MKKTVSFILAASLSVAFTAQPIQAEDGENARAAAAVLTILGAAALMHNDHHYRDGWKPRSHQETADFERGYRDGLHNERYNMRHDGRAYSEGYSAGQKERHNRLSYDHHFADGKPSQAAKSACLDEVASSLNVGRHHVHKVGKRATNRGTWELEYAVGHKHVICESTDNGVVRGMRNGRL